MWRLAALILCPFPAQAACALSLVLAMDVSGSVDAQEYRLQTTGVASAFRAPSLIEAVTGLDGHILVAVTQWSGAGRQHLALDWRRIGTRADMLALADEIEGLARAFRHFSTAIGEALAHGARVSVQAPESCARRVIDVSGDGVSNEGAPPGPWRDVLVSAGVVVNGLAILGAAPDPAPHYREHVIGGRGAFLEIATDFADFPRAILQKLLREIAPPKVLAQVTQRPR